MKIVPPLVSGALVVTQKWELYDVINEESISYNLSELAVENLYKHQAPAIHV